jgi:excisionase family DNA binding protein
MAENNFGPGLMRVDEASQYLAVCRSKIYQLMDSGQLRFVKIGRSRRIPRDALVELVRQNLVHQVSED